MKSLKIAKLLDCFIVATGKNNLIIQRGFTLIEFLVVIAILGAVGSILTGIITFSLRGTIKTNTIENIRQSGNYTISQMAKTIEYAKTFDGLDDGTGSVTVCPVDMSPPTTTQYDRIKVTPFNNPAIEYMCEDVGGGNFKLTSNGTSLIDTTSADSKIRMSACTFACTVSSITDVPIISINFVLQPKTPSALVENFTPPINFENSVTIRNYQR